MRAANIQDGGVGEQVCVRTVVRCLRIRARRGSVLAPAGKAPAIWDRFSTRGRSGRDILLVTVAALQAAVARREPRYRPEGQDAVAGCRGRRP